MGSHDVNESGRNARHLQANRARVKKGRTNRTAPRGANGRTERTWPTRNRREPTDRPRTGVKARVKSERPGEPNGFERTASSERAAAAWAHQWRRKRRARGASAGTGNGGRMWERQNQRPVSSRRRAADGEPGQLAASYCSITWAGMRPRSLTLMPLFLAQARISALRSRLDAPRCRRLRVELPALRDFSTNG